MASIGKNCKICLTNHVHSIPHCIIPLHTHTHTHVYQCLWMKKPGAKCCELRMKYILASNGIENIEVTCSLYFSTVTFKDSKGSTKL